MRREKVKREFALQLYAGSVRAGAVRPVCPKANRRGAQGCGRARLQRMKNPQPFDLVF